MLSIHGKMNRTSNDGSHFYQEIFREYSLPETLKLEKLTSNLSDDGVTHFFLIN